LTKKLSKRQQRADRNRKKILSAAMRVFSRKGYHRATLDEICKRANLGKGTIYQYFRNKKGLFLGIVDSVAAELGRSIQEAVGDIEDDEERLVAAVWAYMEFHAVHRSFYRLLIHEESSFSKEIHERFRTQYFSHLRILEDVLRRGIKSRKLKKMDARSATFALVGMCNLMIFRWIMAEKPHTIEKEVPLILEIFLRGISRQTKRTGA
jgi:TetR/AcrR family transcriptional regulator